MHVTIKVRSAINHGLTRSCCYRENVKSRDSRDSRKTRDLGAVLLCRADPNWSSAWCRCCDVCESASAQGLQQAHCGLRKEGPWMDLGWRACVRPFRTTTHLFPSRQQLVSEQTRHISADISGNRTWRMTLNFRKMFRNYPAGPTWGAWAD